VIAGAVLVGVVRVARAGIHKQMDRAGFQDGNVIGKERQQAHADNQR
jgi:hypothetical protein